MRARSDESLGNSVSARPRVALLSSQPMRFHSVSCFSTTAGDSVRVGHGAYPDLFVPLFGEAAARNAAAAVAAVEALLGRALDQDAVRQGLAAASSPGRLEVVGRHPLIVLDGAHNPDAADALVGALPEAFAWHRLHLVMACFACAMAGSS